MAKTLNSTLKIVLILLVLLTPIFFSTVFVNIFDLPKLIFLIATTLIVLLYFAGEIITKGRAAFKISKVDLPLLLLVLSVLVSGIVKSQNKMELFFFPGIATAWISLLVIYHGLKKTFDTNKKVIAISLTISSTIASVVSILSYLNVFSHIPQFPDFVKTPTFSLLGGSLPEALFLSSILPLSVYLAISEKENIKKVFFAVASAIIIIATCISVSFILPGKVTSPILVSFPISWSVAVDALKASPVFGVGTSNYLTAFNKFLPVSYNQTPTWGARFTTSRSLALTIVTENGILGMVTFMLVILFIVGESLKNIGNMFKNFGLREASSLSLMILSVFFFIFPANIVLVALFFILTVILFTNHELNINLSATTLKRGNIVSYRIPAYLLALLIVAGEVCLIFFGSKAVYAEAKFKTAINALAKNDGKETYDNLRLAINTSPYVDRYHATYAQVNLALARSLAQKKDLTDSDKQSVATLIQQAIKEAKSTSALNPQRAGNWEVLAETYKSVIPFATGADQFAIQSYNQAISLDPINPNLRISLGGVYYALGRYDDAIAAFKLAILAKQDLANAHYNLAIAYREKKDFDNAIKEIQTVLSLVAKGTTDYTLAQNTLNELQKSKSEVKTTGNTSNLQSPESSTSAINPKIDLPADAAPVQTQ